MCLWTRMCVCLLVKVGVYESHCVQLWSRWRPPAPSICLIFLLPPSFIRSPRHANNLQLGQSWLAPCLCTHTSQSHSEMHNSNSPQHETCFKKLNQLELEMPAFFFLSSSIVSSRHPVSVEFLFLTADHRKSHKISNKSNPGLSPRRLGWTSTWLSLIKIQMKGIGKETRDRFSSLKVIHLI